MSMEINNLYSSILQNYRVPTVPSSSVEQIKPQEQNDDRKRAELSAVGTQEATKTEAAPAERKPGAKPEDIALTFNKQDDFGYIGKDSDIRSLDVEHAIDAMQKDKMLEQYQYFVGSARNPESTQSQDGIVIPKF